MKAIKITPANRAKIEAALADVNGRATSFTLRWFSDVERAAKDADEQLAALPKADRVGAVADYTPAGPTASAYKYAAKTTRLVLERRATGWFLNRVLEDSVYPRSGARLKITISEAQRDEIARRAVAEFSVRTEAA